VNWFRTSNDGTVVSLSLSCTHAHTHTGHDHLSLFFLGRKVKLQNYTNAQKKEDMLSE
jgi:hypothetical protein